MDIAINLQRRIKEVQFKKDNTPVQSSDEYGVLIKQLDEEMFNIKKNKDEIFKMVKHQAMSLSEGFTQVLDDYLQVALNDGTKMKLNQFNKLQKEILSNIENIDENDKNELSSIFEDIYECILDEYQQDRLKIIDTFETKIKHTQNNMSNEKEIKSIIDSYYNECQSFIKKINTKEQTRLINSERAIMNMKSEM